mgnify:CR=1 FL=1
MKPNNPLINLAIADDHELFRKGLMNVINKMDARFQFLYEAPNGRVLLNIMSHSKEPDIVLMDSDMPIMNGVQTTRAIKEQWPEIKVMAITMLQDEQSIFNLLQAGADGYLNKDSDPDKLLKALITVQEKGAYYSDHFTQSLVSFIKKKDAEPDIPALNAQEMTFLKWVCTEHTYQMIAHKMCLSIKTIDGYRARLFEKLNVKSRVGLVVYALQNKLVNLEEL